MFIVPFLKNQVDNFQSAIPIISSNSKVLKTSRPANRNFWEQLSKFLPGERLNSFVPVSPILDHGRLYISETGFYNICYLILSNKNWA